MADICARGLDIGFVELGYASRGSRRRAGHYRTPARLFDRPHAHRSGNARLEGSRLAFSAAMQLAALAAVVSYFWNDVRDLATNSVRAVLARRFDNPYFRLSIWIVLATMPIGIAGLALSDLLNTCHSPLRSLSVIGWACVAMAALLAGAELFARHKRTIGDASLVDALLIGVAQADALIPGVSRSGSTLTAALALGFERAE